MKYLSLILLIILLESSAYCQINNNLLLNDSAKILKITYDSGGGRYSNNTILKISKDSTFYMSEKNYNPQDGRYKNYIIRSIKTDSVFLETFSILN